MDERDDSAWAGGMDEESGDADLYRPDGRPGPKHVSVAIALLAAELPALAAALAKNKRPEEDGKQPEP